MARFKVVSQFCLVVALAGCGWQTEDAGLAPARPPAAALAPMSPGTTLSELLEAIERDLTAAIDGELQGDAEAALIRAEAMTDRMFEARVPFRWMQAQQYSVDSRLRQIQSSADRSIAALLSGMPRDSVLPGVRGLREEIAELRTTLEQGGGPLRVPVDVLIDALDTLRTPQQQPPADAPTAGAN
jgi:hypothetical protein